MNTFKECLAEDYSDAIKNSFDKLLGKFNQEGVLQASTSLKSFLKIVEGSDSKRIIDTFRKA